MKKLLYAILIIFPSVFCYPQKVTGIKMTYLYTLINGDEAKGKEYLFPQPSEIKSDNMGNVYVAEYQGSEIRKYSKEGKYLFSLGKAGTGKGEFTSILTWCIEGEKIFVYSVPGKITNLTTDNKLIFEKKVNLEIIDSIWRYVNDNILVKKYSSLVTGENLFYIYDKYLEKNITSFGYSTIFFDLNNPAKELLEGNFNVLSLSNGDVLACSKYYDGRIYKFEKAKNWALAIYKRPGYTYLNNKILHPFKRDQKYCSAVSTINRTSGEQVAILEKTLSRGLFLYKDKYILNFVIQNIQAEKGENCTPEFGCEVYSLTGKYIGYAKIENKEIGEINWAINVGCIDNNGCLYIMGRFNVTPVLKVTKIKKYKMDLVVK
jgi:hypothetical protein